MSAVSRRLFGNLRPAERRAVGAAFFTLFGVLFAHALQETARDALFLSRLPATRLPWVYIAIALLALPVTRNTRGVLRRLQSRYALSLTLAFAAVAALGFWLLACSAQPADWVYYSLYVWSGLIVTVVVMQFWLVLGDLFTVTQAKRLYGFVGAGSVLGAIGGAAAARTLAGAFPLRHILLAAAVAFAASALGPLFLWRGQGPGRKGVAPGAGSLVADLLLVHGNPYLRRVGSAVLISTVAVTIVDYLFKSGVAMSNPDPERLGTLFAEVQLVLSMLALATQTLLVSWLLRTIGVSRALMILPGLLLLGSAGVIVIGGFLPILLLKGVDGTLRHSLQRTGTELLFVPIEEEKRARVKAFIDVVGRRGGQALASLGILVAVSIGPTVEVLMLVLVVLLFAWFAITRSMAPHYLNLFRSALQQGAIRTRVDLPKLDLASLETLIASLSSREDNQVLASLDLLASQGKERLIPALIVYHPARAVVLRALEIFVSAGRSDFIALADRLLDHEDPEIRAAALRARSEIAPDEAVLRAATSDSSPTVHAAAIVGLVAGKWMDPTDAGRQLTRMIEHAPASTRRAVASALRRRRCLDLDEVLLRLADDPDIEVRLEVADAMRGHVDERFLPPLLQMLASRALRVAARETLVTMGQLALDYLARSMGNHELPHEIRRHLPRTISRFDANLAAPILLSHLLTEPDGMVRFKILRGLGRLRTNHPTLPLSAELLDRATRETLVGAYRLLNWRDSLLRGAQKDPSRDTPVHELLCTLLRDKENHAVERLFRLLGLSHPQEDFERIHLGLASRDRRVRSSSRELVDNVLLPPLRAVVSALVDSAPADERLAAAAPFYSAKARSYEQVLVEIIDSGSRTLSALAIFHVGELGMTALRPRLVELRALGSGLLPEVIDRALELLSHPQEEKVAYAG